MSESLVCHMHVFEHRSIFLIFASVSIHKFIKSYLVKLEPFSSKILQLNSL